MKKEILSSIVRAKTYLSLRRKCGAPSSSRDKEISLLLAQLEKGTITPEEYALKFRRLWAGPSETFLKRDSEGYLVMTPGWRKHWKEEIDAIDSLWSDLVSLDLEVTGAYNRVVTWESARLTYLGFEPPPGLTIENCARDNVGVAISSYPGSPISWIELAEDVFEETRGVNIMWLVELPEGIFPENRLGKGGPGGIPDDLFPSALTPDLSESEFNRLFLLTYKTLTVDFASFWREHAARSLEAFRTYRQWGPRIEGLPHIPPEAQEGPPGE